MHYKKLYAMCWISYFVAYMGRINFSAGMAQLISDGALVKSTAGLIGTAAFFAYGAGQMINGRMADRISPKIMVFIGLALSAMCNLLMGFSSGVALMAVICGINGFAQSMLWPSIVRIIATRIPEEHRHRLIVNMSASLTAGLASAYGLTAFSCAFLPHSFIFILPAIFLGIVAVLWISTVSEEKHENAGGGFGKMSKAIFVVLIPVIIAAICQGMLKDGIVAWIPTYISDVFSLPPTVSILTTVVVPIINLSGVYIAMWMYRKMRRSECRVSAWLYIITIALLGIQMLLSGVTVVMALAVFSLATSAIQGINLMLISIIPLRYGKLGLASTVTGTFDAFVYLGSAVSNYTTGYIAESAGWNATILFWMLICALGAASSFIGVGQIRRKAPGLDS